MLDNLLLGDCMQIALLVGLALLPCAAAIFVATVGHDNWAVQINNFDQRLPDIREGLQKKRGALVGRAITAILGGIYEVTAAIDAPAWRAAARTGLCLYSALAVIALLGFCLFEIAENQDTLLPFEIAGFPLLIGLAIGVFAPSGIVAAVDSRCEAAVAYYHRTREQRGFFLKWTLNPALWLNEKIFSATERDSLDPAWRAAIRLMAALYLISLIAVSMYMIVALMIALAVIAIAFLIISKALNWETTNEPDEEIGSPPKSRGPFPANAATSKTRQGFFGAYEEHRREDGRVTGTTRKREGFFGAYAEHRDADGHVTGTSKAREGFFGQYVEHRDEDGNVTGSSKPREGFFGPYNEHKDAGGNVTGETRDKEGFFGPYTEHKPKK